MAFTSRKKKRAQLIALVLLNRRRKQRRTYERLWVKQHIRLHDDKGAFENLVKGFRDDEKEEFVKFLRLEPDQFNFILGKISPLIARKDTTFRKSITAAERLAITLRFLATGKNINERNAYISHD